KYNSATNGLYTIDNVPASPIAAFNVDGYFLQGSVLALYTNNPVGMDITQILTRDSSFIYEQGAWRGSLTGATLRGGVLNLGDVVQQFLQAAPNVSGANPTGNMQQVLVVSNMLSYMSNYNVWAIQYNYSNNSLKTYLQGIQGNMMSAIGGIYNGVNYPT